MKRVPPIRQTKSQEGLDPHAGHDHAFHKDALADGEWFRELSDKAMAENPELARYLKKAKGQPKTKSQPKK